MKNDMSVHVYISNNKIQVLLGSYVKNRLQVQSVCEEPLEEGCILNGIIMNAFSLQNTITQMWQKYNLPSKGVHLVVNGSSVTVKPMKIPQTTPKNIPGLIRTEFRDMENIQNLIVDYSVTNLKNPDGTCSILAVLSTKEFIMSYVNLFKEAKIDLEVIDLVQNCLIKLMKRFKSLQGKTYAVFILDKNMLMQCLFSNDNFVMTRRSRILAEPEDPGFEREIGQNINSIIQFNKSEQTGSDITEFYLSGFPDAAVPLFPRFEENFHVQVRTFPEYTPAEITLPENMRPAEYCILLGSLIRYSN
ncbi:type IV pilus biogenesis protein PilM [uncultured Ruminococcus sp.]|uniref:type IV pilus biogenesis protein PilM n=1 Tax=uncultured Ruminococcus sp. TaxID=165186 RepID=UPI00263774A6|nr:pilus assembly protein PilM [uncultured Ruminococcus sp.]